MKKLILAFACLSLASPALAMALRPVNPATQPVPAGQRDALYGEYNAFVQCLGDTRLVQVRGRGEMGNMEKALNSAGNAAAVNNNGAFQAEAIIFHNELAPLKAKYGC